MNMVILKAKVDGDINIGLYSILNNDLAFVSKYKKYNIILKEALGVNKMIEISVYDTPFVGIFGVMNSYGAIFSNALTDREKDIIKKNIKELEIDINIAFLKSKNNAIGNLILCNDKGAVIGKSLKRNKKEISDILNVEVNVGTIMELDIVGSLGIANNRGFLISAYATEEEFNNIKNFLGVEGDIGTVNYGSPYLKSGILVNDKSLVVGELTTPIETARIIEGLGFL